MPFSTDSLYTYLVTLQLGGTAWRFTPWPADLTISSVTFTATPELEITAGMQHGGTEDKPWSIKMDKTKGPWPVLLQPRASAPLVVTIEEVDPANPGSYRTVLWKGVAGRKRLNPGGARGLVVVDVVGVKSGYKIPVGIPCTTSCSWSFGDPQCTKVPPSQFSTVSAIGGGGVASRVTVGALSLPGGMTALTQYEAGYMEHGGCRIMIRQLVSSGATTVFDLVKVPPAAWVGSSIKLVAGCKKSVADCRGWSNEGRFGGFGINMPPRNPFYEQ